MKPTPKTPPPPVDLSATSAAFWSKLVAEFEFEAHHLELLAQACRVLDRITLLREDIAKRGVMVEDRFEIPMVNPAVDAEAKLLRAFKGHLRELQLDVEPADAGYDRAPRLATGGRTVKSA